MYHAATRQPTTPHRDTHDLLIVRRYSKPSVTPGGIIIPAAIRDDMSQTLWEVEAASDGSAEALGTELAPGDIVVTLRRWPVDLAHETSEGDRLFALHATEVVQIIKRTW